MASTRFLATTLSVGANGESGGWLQARPAPCPASSIPCQAPSPLTMCLFLQVSQAGSPCKDVGLAIKTLSKRVAATRKHVVEHTACREDVHCACLGARETNMRRLSLLPGSLPDSILPQTFMLAKALVQTRTQGCFLSTISST